MIVLQLKLSKFYKFFQNRVKLTFEDVLRKVLLTGQALEFENNYLREEEALKHSHQQEMQNLTKELKNMTFQQEELEKTAKNMKIAEDKYKSQINELSEKKNDMMKTRKKNKKAKESEIVERIEELKEENEEIKEKIALIENNVSNFISEMGGLLEHSEEIEKTNEKRKVSIKKTGKVGKKGRAPLFTIDIGKN